ncbi:MAG: riboflavin kinase [Candidatus Kerfeldbacteria bacterium]|nr:riboflavin kinase [Candidatus Kerfeldbacteria bacterium]
MIHSTVIHGEGIARTTGYPTANLRYGAFEGHDDGIWAAWIFLGDVTLCGVLVLGVPWTTREGKKAEVYLFDFDEDLYGKTLGVELVEKIRDIEEFPNPHDLQRAIENDLAQAQEILNARGSVASGKS